MNEIEFRKLSQLFHGTTIQVAAKGEAFYVFVRDGPTIATIYPNDKRIEFDDDFREPLNLNPAVIPLLSWVKREGYKINKK